MKHKPNLIIQFLIALIFTFSNVWAANDVKPVTIFAVNYYNPTSFISHQGTPSGLYIEFWELWSKTNDIPINIVMTSLEKSLLAVKNKEGIQSGLFINDDRSSWADFSVPFHSVETGILFNKTISKTTKLKDIKSLKVAVMAHSFQADYLSKHYPTAEIIVVKNFGDGADLLLNSEVDALVSEIQHYNYIPSHLKLHGQFTKSDQVLLTNTVHALIAKGQPELLQLINDGIDNIPVKDLIALEKKWLPDIKPYFQIPASLGVLTNAEVKWLRNHLSFSYSMGLNSFPFGFIDTNGVKSGIIADYVNHVQKKLNINLHVLEYPSWTEAFEAFKTGKIDIISDIVNTPERAKTINFTEPYFSAPTVIVTLYDTFHAVNMTSLNNRTVGILDGFLSELLEQNHPKIILKIVSSESEGLKMLAEGSIDAYVGVLTVINHSINEQQLTGLIIAAFTPYPLELSMGVRDGLERLIPILNKVFANLTIKERATIANNWLATQVHSGVNLAQLLKLLIPSILLTMLIVILILNRANKRLKIEITIRKRAEENELTTQQDLIEKDKWLSAAIESFNGMVAIFNEQGRLVISNATFQSDQAYISNNIKLGDSWEDIYKIWSDVNLSSLEPKVRRSWLELRLKLFNQGGQIQPMQDRDGDWFQTNYFKIKGGGTFFVRLNVTEQYIAKEELLQSEIRYKTLYNESPIMMHSLDAEGVLIEVNKQWLYSMGYDSVNVIGHKLTAFMTASTKAMSEKVHLPDLLRTDENKDNKIQFITKNDEIIHLRVNTNIETNAEGKAVAIHSVLIDETKTLQAEERNKVYAQLFKTWSASNFIGIIRLDISGLIIECNDRILNMLGYSRKEFEQGLIDWKVLTPEKYSHLDTKAIEEANVQGYWTPFEKEYIHKNGDLIPIFIGGSLYKKEPAEYIVFIVDMSERIILENQLRQAQKMEAVGQLSSGIAHDFNNILSIILINVEMYNLTSAPEQSTKYMDKIKTAVQRGAKITRGLLDFSRNDNNNLQIVSINQAVNDLVSLLTKSLTVSVDINLKLEPNIWPTNINGGELQDSLLNLSINASHAMPEGGRLTIKTENLSLNQVVLTTSSDAISGDFAVLSVTDEGIGMTPETIDKIFEPFYTTKDPDKGTGLGLSMVHGFVRRMSGYIDVHSELGQGSTFKIYLPRSESKIAEIKTEISQKNSHPTGNETILMVEDEAEILEPTKLFIESLGYTVITVPDGAAAISVLKTSHNINLLFSDIIMPGGINGFDLAKHCLEKYPEMKILLASGFSVVHNAQDKKIPDSLRETMLSKPYSLEQLAISIHKILH